MGPHCHVNGAEDCHEPHLGDVWQGNFVFENRPGIPRTVVWVQFVPKYRCVRSSVPNVTVQKGDRAFKRWGLIGGDQALGTPPSLMDLSLIKKLG